MRIDVHAHLRSPEVRAVFDRLGGRAELDPTGVGQMIANTGTEPEHPGGFAGRVAARIDQLKAAGVDLQIISPGASHPYFADPAAAVEAATFHNDFYRKLCADYAPHFAIFASLPLPHMREALDELGRCLDDPNVMGIALGCSVKGVPIDDDAFTPLWEELNRRRAVVYLHPGVKMAAMPGSHEFHIAPDFGSPSELAVCLARLVVRRIPRKYPDIKILAATLGGAVPFLVNRFDHGFLQQHPQEYREMGGVAAEFKKFYYDASVIEEPFALFAAKHYFGADRIVIGSDAGRVNVSTRDGVDYIETSQYLTPEEKRAILDENAMTLFRDCKRFGVAP